MNDIKLEGLTFQEKQKTLTDYLTQQKMNYLQEKQQLHKLEIKNKKQEIINIKRKMTTGEAKHSTHFQNTTKPIELFSNEKPRIQARSKSPILKPQGTKITQHPQSAQVATNVIKKQIRNIQSAWLPSSSIPRIFSCTDSPRTKENKKTERQESSPTQPWKPVSPTRPQSSFPAGTYHYREIDIPYVAIKQPLKRDLSSDKEMFNEVVDRVIKEYHEKKFKKIEPQQEPKVRVVRLEPMKPTNAVGGLFGYSQWQKKKKVIIKKKQDEPSDIFDKSAV